MEMSINALLVLQDFIPMQVFVPLAQIKLFAPFLIPLSLARPQMSINAKLVIPAIFLTLQAYAKLAHFPQCAQPLILPNLAPAR